MRAPVRLIVEPNAPESDRQIVRDHLDTYNVGVTGLTEYSPVNLFLRDDAQEVLGGLLASIWGGVLYVRILWVAQALRGQGYGGRLLEAAGKGVRQLTAVQRQTLQATGVALPAER